MEKKYNDSSISKENLRNVVISIIIIIYIAFLIYISFHPHSSESQEHNYFLDYYVDGKAFRIYEDKTVLKMS
jgi:uncharacterized membrane protein